MSDENLKSIEDLALDAETQLKTEKSKERSHASRLKLLALSKENSRWNVLQEMFLEIQIDAKLKEASGQGKTTFEDQYRALPRRINELYSDNPETLALLLEHVPTKQGVLWWTSQKGWEEEIVKRLKSYHLFTPEKRTEVIESVRQRAIEKQDVQAAKLWLTMSGDYSDKVDLNDPKFEKYKEYASALNEKSNESKTKE